MLSFSERFRLNTHRVIAKLGITATNCRYEGCRNDISTVLSVTRGIETLTTPHELVEIVGLCRATASVDGDICEVGVYRGGASAVLLSSTTKHVHLCDTFAGLPSDGDHLRRGHFSAGADMVASNLKQWAGRFTLHRGEFPRDTAKSISGYMFSLVRLDIDLYRPTLDSLRFFTPRMAPGGLIVVHDYRYLPGVRRAVDEFADESGAAVLPMATNQCVTIPRMTSRW